MQNSVLTEKSSPRETVLSKSGNNCLMSGTQNASSMVPKKKSKPIPGYSGFQQGKICRDTLQRRDDDEEIRTLLKGISGNLSGSIAPARYINEQSYVSHTQSSFQQRTPAPNTTGSERFPRQKDDIAGYGSFSNYMDRAIQTKVAMNATGH
eukprot:CAMPEP_0185771472 /NCGR_PEP_ID=MMETSP1174-20130828/64330_1 /TAXON_ID=35687 /ORGANISM="Dictyocha speculum, Strain CCMP1381" /LENGTH=150 /DNA_ID=CAMNT_0028457355 /DNA_START=127 /DNA_END=579 /DNA_ORIENTATION=+